MILNQENIHPYYEQNLRNILQIFLIPLHYFCNLKKVKLY